MRILFTSTGSWGTGSFTVIDAVVAELQAMGHEVLVLFPDNEQPGADDKTVYQNSEHYHVWQFPIISDETALPTFPLMIADPHPRNPNPCIFKHLSESQLQLYLSAFSNELQTVIDRFQPDVIECQHIWAMGYVMQELNYPYISVAHHSDQMGFHYDPRMQAYAAKAAEQASRIFAISDFVKHNVCELYPVEANKVAVLSNGYDRKQFKSLPVNRTAILEKFDVTLPDDANIVTFAGKLSRTKGIDIILQANQLLGENDNVHFLILGAGSLDEIMQNEPDFCLDRMHFLGHQPADTLAQLHNIAKLSIMPSRHEGFGIAGLEAMACGLPLIATRCGGPDSFAVGEIIDKENPQQLACAIKKIVTMPDEQYQQLSKQARQKAQTYSWTKITEQRLQYYQEVIEQFGRPVDVC